MFHSVSSSSERNWIRLAVTVAAAVGVGHLLVIDLGNAAPLRSAGRAGWPSRVTAAHFADADEIILRAAAGHNLQLVIDSPDQADPRLRSLFTQLYFRAVYTLMPKQVLVGKGERVINDWDQLSHAAANPGGAFAAAHDVHHVLALSAAGGAMSLDVSPAD